MIQKQPLAASSPEQFKNVLFSLPLIAKRCAGDQVEPPEVFYKRAESQNREENTCARAPFLIKWQASDNNFNQKETLSQNFFPANFAIFTEHLFYRTPLSDCFCALQNWM